MVQSYEASGEESVESEKNRFTIIPKGKQTAQSIWNWIRLFSMATSSKLTGKTQVGRG
jgi:hypothetical protein